MKASRYGSPVEWHQDWAFYPHTNDDLIAVGRHARRLHTRERAAPRRAEEPHRPHRDHHAEGHFCGAVDPATIKAEIDRAVPLTGRAGSMSFHHVRLLHGSAQNVSDRPRALLLYEYGAADAWPLMGVKDLAEFDARLVTGEPSIVPRVTPAPVRMPLPPAIHQGSIYENQTRRLPPLLRHHRGVCRRKGSSSLSENRARARRRVQLRGGARRQPARRTFCTLSRLSRAPTKQMGPSPSL